MYLFSRDLCSIGEEGGGVSLPWIHVHSPLCESYLELLCCIVLWWIGGGYLGLRYMCILPHMTHNQCSSFPGIFAQLEEGVGSVCHGYMSILLYMKFIQCSSFQEIYG